MRIEGIRKALELRFDTDEEIARKLEVQPSIAALLAIELRYGPFYIYFNDASFKKKDNAAAELLFNNCICELGHDNLIFYDKRTYKPKSYNSVYGVNLDDLSIKYIDMCLHANTLVRYKNSDGEGYATNNIREIILTSGVSMSCIR